MQQFLQYQVVLKPPPDDVLALYIESLRTIGIDPARHDIRLVEDDWEAPTLGASGLGWEVWLDGMEITQFTYFQQAGSLELEPISAEITYGLLRLCLYLQKVESVLDVEWAPGITWGEMNLQAEQEFSAFHFEHANAEMYFRLFQDYEREAAAMLKRGTGAAGLRLCGETVARVQPARCARRDQCHRAHLVHRSHPRARAQGGGRLHREARGSGIPAREAAAGAGGPPSPAVPEAGMKDFVLEIGAENIPASYVPPAIDQLRNDAVALFARLRIGHGEVYATGTPRRLVLVVNGVEDRQAAGEEVATGPPVSKGFLADGAPSPAAEGFARAQGVAVAALERIATPRGEYLGVRRTLPRRATRPVLQAELNGLVTGLRFPKTMKWEAGGARFARPVRWIVCLLGRDVVRFSFAGVDAGRVTCGRPWMRSERRSIAEARAYRARVGSLRVVLDHETRRQRIRQMAEQAAAARRQALVGDDDLLTELAFMLEDPRPLVGSFDRRYLDLPAPVIVTAMRSHQRYLALNDRAGRLVPGFVTFTDGPVRGAAEVVRGNERVLRARLEDAEFYWHEDIKRGVDKLADELDRIVFIEGLGSVGEKWRRTLELARDLNGSLSPAARVDDAALARAARLAKADLASTMIRDGKEFTALQGVIGAHYAVACGEPAAVADAIRDHYAPRAASDPLPETQLGRVLGLADRMDTITGCFIAGLKPTGSQDPFALRRSANGAVRLACEMAGVRLDHVIEAAVAGYANAADGAKPVGPDVVEFVRGRVDAFLRDQGVSYDVAAAVLAAAWAEPALALARARAIGRLRGDRRFERLITGVRRVGNILAGKSRRVGPTLEQVRAGFGDGGERAFDPSLFEDPAEGELLNHLVAAVERIAELEGRQQVDAILGVLSGLADPIDTYFDKVLVNSDDVRVRANRHAFLAATYALFGRYADFLAIVEETRPS